MKKILLLILSTCLIVNHLQAQNYLLEVKGKVTVDGVVLKVGDEIKDSKMLKFDSNAEVRLLTPKGYCILKESNPKTRNTQIGALVTEILSPINQKNLNTRSFVTVTDAEISSSLSSVLGVLKADKSNINIFFNRYIVPFFRSRYDKIDMTKVENVLTDKFKLSLENPMGCFLDERSYKKAPQATRLTKRSYTVLPASYSLKNFCPTPQNQSFSDCVGWSTTYGARTIMYAIKNKLSDKAQITNESFAPSFTYGQIKIDPADAVCKIGTYIFSALELLKSKGAPKYRDFEYECNPSIDQQDLQNAKIFKIKDFKRLTSGYDAPRDEVLSSMKKSLSESKPVVIAMPIYPSFMCRDNLGYSVKTDVWDGQKSNKLGGHAMTLIGYDDNKYGGAFEILNSWGTNWGNEGFIWIRYNDFVANVEEAYELIDSEDTKPTPTPSPTPKPTPTPTPTNDLSGSFRILLDDNTEMPVQLANGANRDFVIVQVEKSTYSVTKPYASGTQFRLQFTNNQPAYVYVIGYNSTSKNVSPIFPFENFSAYLDYKQNEVAIPNEDYYIQMDNTVGTEYLCILYSKEELDIQSITQQIQTQSGGFNNRLKAVLKDKLVDGSDIKFQQNKVSFDAMSNGKTVIPIVVEVKHTN